MLQHLVADLHGRAVCRDAVKAAVCANCLQFLQMQEEEFAPHLRQFVTTIWGLLVRCGAQKGQDGLAMAATAFLTSVCRSTHFALFSSGDTLKQVRAASLATCGRLPTVPRLLAVVATCVVLVG